MKYHFANNKPIAIDPGAPNPIATVMNITDVQGFITDVNVTVDVAHTLTSDLNISLMGPDDDTFQPISNAAAYFSVSFKPEQSTEIVNERAPNIGRLLSVIIHTMGQVMSIGTSTLMANFLTLPRGRLVLWNRLHGISVCILPADLPWLIPAKLM